jgi:DNA-binding transcriptional ArsR family regulator
MKNLTQGERKFLNFLVSKASNGILEVSLRELARELGISHPAILKKVKILTAKGAISYQKGRGKVPSRIIVKDSGITNFSNVKDLEVTKSTDVKAPKVTNFSEVKVTKSHNMKVTKTQEYTESTKTEGYQKEDTRVTRRTVTKTLDARERSKGDSGEAPHDEARSAVIRWLKMGGPPDAREIAAAADLPVSAVERALAEIQRLPERLNPSVGITCASAERGDVSAEPGQTTLSVALDHIGDAGSIKPRKHVADAEPPSEKTSPVSPIQASFSQATTKEALASSREETAKSEPAPRSDDTSGEAGVHSALATMPVQPPPPPAVRVENEKVLESSHNKERLKTLTYHLKKLTESNGAALETELLHIYTMQGWGKAELREDLAALQRQGKVESVGSRRWQLK